MSLIKKKMLKRFPRLSNCFATAKRTRHIQLNYLLKNSEYEKEFLSNIDIKFFPCLIKLKFIIMQRKVILDKKLLSTPSDFKPTK